MSNKTTSDNLSTPCNFEKNNYSKPQCYDSFDIALPSYIIIAVLSPVAVVGNSVILAAIWRKTFQRTPFHILLSGLAITDLCTGLVSQPFLVAAMFLKLKAGIERTLVVVVTRTIGDSSATYFITVTVFIITLMSVERWLHMSRRSLVTSTVRRGCLTVTVILLIPIPLAIFRSLDNVNQTAGKELNITIISMTLICFLTTTVTYFKVFQIIRHHQLQVQINARSQNCGPPTINFLKYKKSVVTIVYVIALFSFCFLPYTANVVVYIHLGSNTQTCTAANITVVILFLSSSLNPCLYLWRMNDVRHGVKQLFY